CLAGATWRSSTDPGDLEKRSGSSERHPCCAPEYLARLIRLRRSHELRLEMLRSENSPPWQRRGGRAIKKYSRSFKRRGRGGSFNLRIDPNGSLNEPPRLRPAKVASRHFIDGRSHPSFAKEGNSSSFCFPRLSANCLARSGSLKYDYCCQSQTRSRVGVDMPFADSQEIRRVGR